MGKNLTKEKNLRFIVDLKKNDESVVLNVAPEFSLNK
jgi:hypothetical protein